MSLVRLTNTRSAPLTSPLSPDPLRNALVSCIHADPMDWRERRGFSMHHGFYIISPICTLNALHCLAEWIPPRSLVDPAPLCVCLHEHRSPHMAKDCTLPRVCTLLHWVFPVPRNRADDIGHVPGEQVPRTPRTREGQGHGWSPDGSDLGVSFRDLPDRDPGIDRIYHPGGSWCSPHLQGGHCDEPAS